MTIQRYSETALSVEDDDVNDQTEMWWSKLAKKPVIKTQFPEYTIVPAHRSSPPGRALFLVYEGKPIGYLFMDNVSKVFDKTPRELWSPHSYIAREHRGKGLIASLYQWALNSGVCFITSGSQSSAAYYLWSKLGKTYQKYWVDFEAEQISTNISDYVKSLDGTEMLLLGRGRSISEFTFKG